MNLVLANFDCCSSDVDTYSIDLCLSHAESVQVSMPARQKSVAKSVVAKKIAEKQKTDRIRRQQ